MIKVHYDAQTTIVKGYYPSDINYNFIPEPYIEIDNSMQIADKTMCVVNGVYQEYIKPLAEQLQDAKQAKLAELEVFHNSPAVKTLTVNGVHKVSMVAEYRALLREQIALMKDQVEFAELNNQTLDINTLVWNFKVANNGFIPLSYLALVYISTTIMDITNPNFATKQTHIDAIKALATIEEVNNYDYTAGYILNHNINLA